MAGATQADVAAIMGTSTVAVSRWLGGKRRPPDELRGVLKRLVGNEAAECVMARIVEPEEVAA